MGMSGTRLGLLSYSGAIKLSCQIEVPANSSHAKATE